MGHPFGKTQVRVWIRVGSFSFLSDTAALEKLEREREGMTIMMAHEDDDRRGKVRRTILVLLYGEDDEDN